jgi:hypothetical protein
MLPAPVSYGGYDPCNVCAQPVAINPCAVCAPPVAMQPVQQTVYREVPVTKYKPVQRTVQKPVIRTVYEDRPVTAYKQVVETKTVDVPTTAYQTVTECRPCVRNNSRWQTTYQRVPKMSPCQYDPNPTLLGWMNRNAYSMRMAFTPNYTRQRQFVPNVVAYNVPVNRVVAVPTTRQMTYNVARMEPYQTTQKVAVLKTEYVDTTVTAYEPYTEMQTVAVGTTTTYAFVDPVTGGTATALNPIADPIRSANANPTPTGSPAPTAAGSSTDDLFPAKPLSYPKTKDAEPAAEPTPGYFDARHEQSSEVEVARPIVSQDGWKPARANGNAPAIAVEPRRITSDIEVVIAARK